MKFRVVIAPDEDGVFVAECPSLADCVSQGKTRDEALANIGDAIQGYLRGVARAAGAPGGRRDTGPLSLFNLSWNQRFEVALWGRSDCQRDAAQLRATPTASSEPLPVRRRRSSAAAARQTADCNCTSRFA
jgi:predicted RNase H-like HicB family nuclease